MPQAQTRAFEGGAGTKMPQKLLRCLQYFKTRFIDEGLPPSGKSLQVLEDTSWSMRNAMRKGKKEGNRTGAGHWGSVALSLSHYKATWE
ncbi:hypothetical protein P7K49_002743, partial [Saguinus oedipus]